MPLNMFSKTVSFGMVNAKPNEWYRDLEQAFINSQWDNTTSVRNIQEQKVIWNQKDSFEKFTFVKIPVWVNSIVGQTTTGAKTGRDFLQIIFKDNHHPKLQGRYYIVDNEYYISYFDDRVVDIDANLSIRRCNEWLKIVDPLNGSIYKLPCVVDYDMTAPSVRVTQSIITPNNHATVKVQKNAMSDRLFRINSRFILGGRPFRITGMQNAINQFIDNNLTSLMTLDLFLDEIWDSDDLVNGVADNGSYHYEIYVPNEEMYLKPNDTGKLFATVLLNGQETFGEIVWSSSAPNVISITPDGEYEVKGGISDEAYLIASLAENSTANTTVHIFIVSNAEDITDVILTPFITSIREFETINVNVAIMSNGLSYTPDSVMLTVMNNDKNYLTYTQNNSVFNFHCIHRQEEPVGLIFDVNYNGINLTKVIEIKLTSMLG